MNGLALIIGLGNPGSEYRNTRHNAGFMLADLLAQRWQTAWRIEKKFYAEVAESRFAGRRVVLCRPQTFMNASGKAVGLVASYFKITPENLLVLVDDADLPLGSLRLRPEGSAGGHHGLESVEQVLGSRGYPRLKVGIARPDQGRRDIAGHVLGEISPAEQPVWQQILQRAAQQVECWATEGVGVAMNRFNGSAPLGPDESTNAQRNTK